MPTETELSSSHVKDQTSDNGRSATLPAISVIVHTFNNGNEVPVMYRSLRQGLESYGKSFEMIFVDDASTDDTHTQLLEIARLDQRVKVIRMRTSFGETSALDAGLHHALGERLVFATARVRVNLHAVPRFLQKLDEGYDLVVGWRTPRQDAGVNRIVSRLFNGLMQKLGKLKLHDINSSVIATYRSVLQNITFYGNLNIFIPVLAARKGYKVTEEQIEQLPGNFRKSLHLSEYIQRILDIITVMFLTKYSKKPLHFLGFFGLMFTLAGLVMNLYLFVYRILGYGAIAGRPLLLLGALLLVIGLQMISIGLIGEMIIYTHAREIKEYNIETVVGE
ncbi:MAG: glycosyltransferase [candidate division KSB1 bacterium]|nr:glycosyltransferase [candidate division KSB1 bacterium]MDZ7303589.1 glycosyltransferase [candidate division KSB1 bacterium]MDZ7312832.1 glycosyltransferase [candidate division KSB1 bacterium]